MDDDEYVAKLDGQAEVLSLSTYVEEATRLRTSAAKIDDANSDGLPDTRQGMTEVLTHLYDKGLDNVTSPGQIRSLLGKGDPTRPFDTLLLTVETRETHGINGGMLLAELTEDLKPLQDIEGLKIGYAGFVFERYQIVTEMTNGMTRSTFVSIILCTAIVVLLFKSLRFGLITALPVVLITGWILGGMYLFDFTLNVITATITAMSIGIGIDYSIHIVQRYRHERRDGYSITDSMTRSLQTTGPSLLAAAGTTVSGFMVLAFAKIGMIHSFGILASLAIVFALIGSVAVLPAVLVGTETIRHWLKNRPKT